MGTINFILQTLYHIFDKYFMLLIKGDRESYKDSMGRTFEAWLIYGRPERLAMAMDSCLVPGEKHWILWRHPEHQVPTSRDHWSYYIQFRKLRDTAEEFKKFIKRVPRMRGMTYWFRSLTGSKWYQCLYYSTYIPIELIGVIWNKFWRCIGGIKPERSHEDWEDNFMEIQTNISDWTDWVRNNPLIPTYSLYNKGLQIMLLPECRAKRFLKWILRGRIGKYNYMLRMFFGDTTVTAEEVYNYRHRTGWRWGVNLDESCRRDVRIIRDRTLLEHNALETDMLIWTFHWMVAIGRSVERMEEEIRAIVNLTRVSRN